MTSKLLLPNYFKKIGWILLIPAAILGVLLITESLQWELKTRVFAIINQDFIEDTAFFTVVETNILNTITGILFIVGALFVGFSKEKTEDEFIKELRLSSLLWSVWVNYILLFLAFCFIYGMSFLNVMIYNMFTVLIIFIIRFNYILYRNTKLMAHEK